MLSIGKLGAGHHAYYERSVASGAEDYYTGKGEARGSYLGRGADALGLDGIVEAGDLRHLFEGTHPRSGEEWVRRRAPDRKPRQIRLADGRVVEGAKPVPVAAFDLTFSAPKSVSVLWGLSDPAVQREVREGHDVAVRAAFDYLERTACVTRRGAGGARQLRGDGFVGAAFRHRVSRAGDPQLHTHVLVANATWAEDRHSALYGRLLYREAKTAGYLYHAALRAELAHRLGVEWHRDPASPHPEIAGVSRELRDVFSKRATEIAEQLAVAGLSSARAANAAALDTRAAKSYLEGGVDLTERWRGEAREIDAPSVDGALDRVERRYPRNVHSNWTADQIAREAFAPTGLTATKTTFHRRDVMQLVADHELQGASVEQIERYTDHVLDRHHWQIVQLGTTDAAQPEGDAVRSDGLALTDGRTEAAFTTRELLDAELSIIHSAQHRAEEGAAQVDRRAVARLLDQRATDRPLADEQRRMVEQLTTSGAGVEVVVGLAGAGKTYSLAAAHEAWQTAGIEVRGTSTALTAAKTLEADTGIRSETVAMLRAWHELATETGDTRKLDDAIPRRGVLVVDEAGMTDTRDLAFLTNLAAERDTKLVLVGDHRQLPEIGAGGSFAHLVHTLKTDGRTSQLVTNRRQVEAWERATLSELRSGSVEQAVVTYAQQDRIVTDASPEQLRERLAADWLAVREQGRDTVMIAYTRADTQALNDAARRLLDECGQLGTERVVFAGREFATGDELVCTRNQRSLGLTNGTRGTVEHVSAQGLDLRTPNGEHMYVPRDYLTRGYADHAYATTGHKTQGITVHGEAFVLATDHVSREWLYVTLSRATDQSRIYIDTLGNDPATGRLLTPSERRDQAILDLHDLAGRSARHTLATTHGPADPDHLDKNDLRRHLHRERLMLEHELASRTLARELQHAPPRYLLPIIGSVPMFANKKAEWLRDAVKLETHRRQHHLTEAQMTRDAGHRILGRERSMGQARYF